MSLNEIINGKRKSPFVLITDTVDQGGDMLLNAIIQSYVAQKCEVHVACFEHHLSYFKEVIRATEDSNIHYHDFFTDHRGWLGYKPRSDVNINLRNIEDISAGNFILVIDSIASMIINETSTTVYKLLHRLIVSYNKTGSKLLQVVGLLHKDMVDNFEVAEISHLASTVLRVQPPKEKSHGRPLCYVNHRTTKGKVCRGVEHYSVDSCNRLWSEAFKETAPSNVAEPVDPMTDVTTFKLSLGEKEKEARSQLILPYLRSEPANDAIGSSVIHYEPDEADDWDEEDPDNDLNI